MDPRLAKARPVARRKAAHARAVASACAAAVVLTVVAGTAVTSGRSGSADEEPRAVRTAAIESARATGPNIVVLILDDVGAHDGRVWERLPTIRDRFLEQGVEFADFHGETPTCCPGRVGFLTGLHTHAHRVTHNDGRLFQPRMSIATALRRRGYFTILGGKYLNVYEHVTPKVPPGWDEFHAFQSGYYDYPFWSNGRREWHGRRPSDYSTDVVARKIVMSLRRAPRHRPVFVWAAPYASHGRMEVADRHQGDRRCADIPPWNPPGYMERDVSDKPAYVRTYPIRRLDGQRFVQTCRTLLPVDDLLRRITESLRRQGRLANTLFILTSDNGMNYGMHRLPWKMAPYATHLPFFASWPDRIGVDRPAVDARLQNIDLAPTLCEIAGCRLGPYPTGQRRPDGRSFAALLLGEGPAPPRSAVLATFRSPRSSVPRWYGVETTRDSPLAASGCDLAADRGCRWSYVRYDNGDEELYDLSNGPCWEWQMGEAGDPCRLENLARRPAYREIKESLRRQLAVLKRE
jgi:N-acetylglucosamine-6-sulfatase